MFSVSNRSPQANTIQSMEHHRSPQQQQQHHHHHHHLSVHQPSIRHQPDATWAHSMELSPIIDVSPSLEAAEANDSLDRRRNTLQSNADNLKTITGMIDDFNRTIKNLGLSDMKNTTLMNSLDQSTPSTLSSDKKIGWDQSVSERDESRKILTRRASTGPTEGLDQYHSVKDQYHYKSWKPSSASSTITLSSSVASSIRPSTTLGSNRSNLMKKPSSLLTSTSATTTTTTAISIASNLNQEISNRMQSKSDTITLANSNQIEQHLQKQQQILIQQQQKLLQIQLEQQRLQNQIHEQQQKQHQQQQSSKSINDSTKETQRAMSGEQRRYPIESATNRLRKDGKTTVSTTSCGSTTSSLTQNHSKPLISVRALGPLDQSPSSSSSVYNQSNRQSRYRDTSTLITQHRKLPKPTGEDILSGDSRSKSIIQKSFLHQQKQQEKLGGKSYPETKRSTMNITNVSNIPQLVSSRTRSDGTVQEPRTSSTGTTTAMISPKKNTQFSTRQFLSQPQTNIVTKEKVRTLNYLDLDTKSMVSKNDNIRDGQSLKSANTRRRLPAAPAEEESISSLINTKRLIREKLGAPIKLTSNFRDDNRILFSSSYDSTIGLNKSGTKFSQMAATANRSRANTTNESMKIIKSKSDIVPGAYSIHPHQVSLMRLKLYNEKFSTNSKPMIFSRE
ncbi:hypothetical protein QR98_0005240 [Sarcoptes scabiei]|uniref:Uncharacterized protein n=1 Tax=Sarcoptes scabiei TaxID=52283 RepID=A0A131ZTK1_SARSC|nr:hypothetical protein QR98_0005240 [Sarcoptes scabiei]